MKHLQFLVLCVTLLLASCFSKDNAKTSACNTLVEVTDKTGLDGCGLLLELEDGNRLMAIDSKVENFPLTNLKAGQTLKIAYTIKEGVATICMAGKTVTLTCVEVLKEKK